MATTIQFYIAMGLIIFAVLVFILMVYLLLNPSHNVFDKIGKYFRKKK